MLRPISEYPTPNGVYRLLDFHVTRKDKEGVALYKNEALEKFTTWLVVPDDWNKPMLLSGRYYFDYDEALDDYVRRIQKC